jgi:hypothetical protein
MRERRQGAAMSKSYWHLLDEDEWAELVRSEQLPSIDRVAIALGEAAAHRGPNGAALKYAGPKSDAIVDTKAPPIAAEMASLIALLGIPLQALSLTSDRRRMAVQRLNSILFEGGVGLASSGRQPAAEDAIPMMSGRLRASGTF